MKKILTIILSFILAASLMTSFTSKVEAAGSPKLNLKTASIQAGKTMKLKVSGGSGKIKWKSSKKSVATVDKNGKVKGKKAGSAKITATRSGKKMTCTINVADKSQKNLVVYFSMTNTTKSAANKIKKAVNADIVRIQPKTAYTNNYDKLTKLAQKEYKKKTNPKRATKIYNMSQYSTIYIGFPVWWDNCPRLVQAFIKDYNLKGKTVVPFCTSGGSGIDGSMKAVKASAKGADVKDGNDLTDMSSGDIAKWAKKYMAEKSSDKQDTADNTTEKEGKTLVAYFSATGNTKPYAEQISGSLGADLYEIVPSVPYTSADLNYNTDCRANTEQNDPSARPEISGSVSDMSQYDTIFIGFPIWWGTCPKIIDTFIEAYDLSGKKIVPFCTSGSTGISTAKGHIAEKCSSSTVEEGHRCANTDDVESWLKSTGYTK